MKYSLPDQKISIQENLSIWEWEKLKNKEADANVVFTHINKVKIGELERCRKFVWN